MSKEKISVSTEINAGVKTIYNDWLSSKGHSAFTGGDAQIENKINTDFTAWNGYISGVITKLVVDKLIIQSWRTAEFKESEENSILEILLEDLGNDKSRISFNHSNLPEGTGEKYIIGWEEHYIAPMKEYYN